MQSLEQSRLVLLKAHNHHLKHQAPSINAYCRPSCQWRRRYILQFELQKLMQEYADDITKKFAHNFWFRNLLVKIILEHHVRTNREWERSITAASKKRLNIWYQSTDNNTQVNATRLASLEKQARFRERLGQHGMVENDRRWQLPVTGDCRPAVRR